MGNITLWEKHMIHPRRERREFFFHFLSSPETRVCPKPREKELPLISVNLASVGTSSQAKTKRKRLTMFMFCLLAKDDFNTNTASTINTFFFFPPPISRSLCSAVGSYIDPRGF